MLRTCHEVSVYGSSCSESNVWYLPLSSLKSTADETLFLELARRSYDLSKLRENESTAEIIKIS